MNTNREQQFDELMRSKLEAYSEAPDMELMQPIRMRARRVMSLYHIARILMLVAMAGAGLYGYMQWNQQLPTPSVNQGIQHSQPLSENNSFEGIGATSSTDNKHNLSKQVVVSGNPTTTSNHMALGHSLSTSSNQNKRMHVVQIVNTANQKRFSESDKSSAIQIQPAAPLKSDLKDKSLAIEKEPCMARFTYYTGYQGEKVFAPIADGKGKLQYEWQFGDGKTSLQAAPEHTYSNNGTYAVKLILKDEQGCTGEYSEQVQVMLPAEPQKQQPNSIRGIIKAGSEPVAVTRVLLIPVSPGEQTPNSTLQSVTNQQGEFEFKNVNKGSYYIQALSNYNNPQYTATYWGNTAAQVDAPQVFFSSNEGESLAGYSIDLIYLGAANQGEIVSNEVLLLDQNNRVVGRGTIDASGHVKVVGQLTGSYKVMDPQTGNISGDVNLSGSGDQNNSGGLMKSGNKNENAISLTPNPATNSVNVGLQTTGSEQTTVIVLDQNGKEMMRNTVTMTSGNNQVPIDISPLPGGVYYVVVIKADGSLTSSRLVKNDLSGR